MYTKSNPKEKKSSLHGALFLLLLLSILFVPTNISAQVEAYGSLNSWGKTKDGRYAICHK
jgi:hypothetical protein